MWQAPGSNWRSAYPSTRLKEQPGVILAALVMAVAIVALGLPTSAAGTICRPCGKPRPDLVVTDAVKVANPYVFKGDETRLSFRDKTKNVGVPAGRSRTGMLLQPDDMALDPLKLGSRKVPALGHGESSAGTASDRLSTAILPLGLYKVYVCADVTHRIKESNEKNNCQLKGYFYVIQKSWYGSVNGVGPANGAARAERWKTLGAHLDFAKWLGGGTFRYDFSGTVEWTDHGTNNGGCTTNGHGEKDFSTVPGVQLNYLRHEYGGVVPTGGHYYTITSSGPPGFSFCNGTEPGPLTTDILRTYSDAHPGPSFPLKFDQNKLAGGFIQAGGAEDTHWEWDFQ